jgi:GNAT superfamily N-acetyltransferase
MTIPPGYKFHISYRDPEEGTGDDFDRHIEIVAEHNKKPIGHVTGTGLGNDFTIGSADLERPHRGKGIGKHMYNMLFQEAAKHNHTNIRSEAASEAAQNVHRKIAAEAQRNIKETKFPHSSSILTYKNPFSKSMADLMTKGHVRRSVIEMKKSFGDAKSKLLPGTTRTRSFDYSSILPKSAKDEGYTLTVKEHRTVGNEKLPSQYQSQIHNPNKPGRGSSGWLGSVLASRHETDSIGIHDTDLGEEHRGKGLGKAMYEALYHHVAKNGVKRVEGGIHTKNAQRVHESIARKHGVDYNATEGSSYEYKLPQSKKMAASELVKGAKGDWKKEGYTFKFHKPKVEMFNGKHDITSHRVTAHDSQGNRVGDYNFSEWPEASKYKGLLHVTFSGTDPDHQRKGLASAAYSLIEKQTGKKLHSNNGNRSADAKALWNQPKRPFGKGELNKGAKGNFKDEGTTLHHTDMGEGYHKIHAKDKSGKTVGLFKFGPAKEHETHIVPMQAEVHEAHRRKGIGSAAYALAEKVSSKKLKPSQRQTQDAKSLWSHKDKQFGKS